MFLEIVPCNMIFCREVGFFGGHCSDFHLLDINSCSEKQNYEYIHTYIHYHSEVEVIPIFFIGIIIELAQCFYVVNPAL